MSVTKFNNTFTKCLQKGGATLSRKSIDTIDFTLKKEISELYKVSDIIRQHAGYQKINQKTVLTAIKMKYPTEDYTQVSTQLTPTNSFFSFITTNQTGGNFISDNKIRKFVQETYPNNKISIGGLRVLTLIVNHKIKGELEKYT